MGLFNFFKTAEQRKQQVQIEQLKNKIFPGGNTQMENELEEIGKLLNFRYTSHEIRYAYFYACVSFYTSNFTNGTSLSKVILRNSKCTLNNEDAEKIAQFVILKKHFNPSTSLGDVLMQKSDGDKLFMIAFGGIVEIKRAYKDLSNYGKFEVLLFNSLIALQEYQENFPDKYEEIKDDFFKNIFNQAKVYQIPMNNNQLLHFINSRFETYLEELLRFFDEEESHLLLKTYTLFYKAPLESDSQVSLDLFEYGAFLPGLMQMRNYVIEKVYTTF